MFSTKEKETAKQIVRYYFKNDAGEPFELTDGQAEIFLTIFLKRHNRVEIVASTQYGKSSVVAMALIIRTHAYGDSFAIVTGQENKSQIIMEKVIQHTFDHPDLYSQLEI
jgi:hypothetical protein